MKVKELIERLQGIDQDTNRLGFYAIDVNTEFGAEEESKSLS